jgi:hypothetical protein
MGEFSPWGGSLPWDWNWPLTLVTLGLIVLVTTLTWTWTRAGRDRWVDFDPSAGERVEDFAGIIRETGGRLPLFIWLVIGSVVGFIAYYIIAVTVGGYKY